MHTPADAKTVQGFELPWVCTLLSRLIEKGVNAFGHFVFTRKLIPQLLNTAQEFPMETRVIWLSSYAHLNSPKGIIDFENVNLPKADPWKRYGQSKAV
jgi:NAD(P)-dependent dehydrogenase (short-subunit alcohol dehydrogenase family)